MTGKKKLLDSTLERLKNVLDEHYDGDFEYTFKFIVPFGKLEELKTILNEHNLIERSSRNGKYISVTMIRKNDCMVETIARTYGKPPLPYSSLRMARMAEKTEISHPQRSIEPALSAYRALTA